MSSKSNKDATKDSADAQDEAAAKAEEPETVDATPASTSTSNNALSDAERHTVVGAVQVIPEHVQDDGEASHEGGGA